MLLEPVDETSIKKIAKLHNVEIKDRKELYASYLWFIKGGGLFLKYNYNSDVTFNNIEPGQDMNIVLKLLDISERFPINGKVVFFNKNGFGVSFPDTEQMKILKENIERNTLDFTAKGDPTFTL